ncbi:MAG: arginine--tRNA ligase [Pseudomonadota bacterium]|uniref:arginine--tRNA ligase n=1 Tax=Gallaecimonas pentaromativorans TaxID=584787 RepID=UPI00067EDAA1|nr:arginine--tRNA ligase [Gallaecimonas pentaromativorans]MED5526198.1 arginine--tRNA ligase [Pseudomonadota bacterium]
MNIQALLNDKVGAAMVAAGAPVGTPAAVRQSARPEFGDYQANGVMGAAKRMGQNPREFAQKLLDNLDLADIADKLEIAGPGFINIFLKPQWLAEQAEKAVADADLAVTKPASQTVVVDYSSPNLAKEMHVGHLRSTIIGDAVARTLEFLGHKVVRQNHVGDWGTQFGMLLAYLEKQKAEGKSQAEMGLSDLEVFYRAAKGCFDEDEAFANRARELVVLLQGGDQACLKMWREFNDISLAHCLEVYEKLNVSMTRADVMGESAYNDDLAQVVADLDATGLLVEDQGAKCVFLDEFKNKDGSITPIIIQKAGGGYLYATTDLAAMRYRNNVLKADRALYFVDQRQALHFKQVFTLAHKAGFVRDALSLEHMGFGTMNGEDGRPFKTRSGGTVKLIDLLNEAEEKAYQLVKERGGDFSEDELKEVAHAVGIGAVKYADLSKHRSSDYIFSFDAMLSFEGNTAPYMLYAYTRVASIFRKAGIEPQSLTAPLVLGEPQEKALAQKLVQFEETIESVVREGAPHYLCLYLFELAGLFSGFYEACPILSSEDESVRGSRLKLAHLTARTLKQGLDLLGIKTLERM